jgi:hypothetical protein
MTVKGWIWKSVIAGTAGTIVHALFMYSKSRTGLLPSFQPYHSFQTALSHWVGADVPAIVPWALSFLNGMAIWGFLFGRINGWLPGHNGVTKGLTFGVIGWVLMGLIFFPLIGLGPFAFGAGLASGRLYCRWPCCCPTALCWAQCMARSIQGADDSSPSLSALISTPPRRRRPTPYR